MIPWQHIKILGLTNLFRILHLITGNFRIGYLIKFKIAVGIALLGSKFGQSQTVEFPNRPNQADTLNLDVTLNESSKTLCYVVVVIRNYHKNVPISVQEQSFIDEFVNENLQYPDSALNNKIEGDVVVNVIIDDKGIIIKADLLRKLGYGLDEEAMRLVMILPKLDTGELFDSRSIKNRSFIFHFELPK